MGLRKRVADWRSGIPPRSGSARRSSITDQSDYLSVCDRASESDSAFATFRRQRAYRDTLDHVTPEQGLGYLRLIKRQSPSLLAKELPMIRHGDDVGDPFVHDFAEVGVISPTTLRYAKVLSDLETLFGNLNGADIVEIGVGFGGQARMVMERWDVRSYTLIDLDPVLRLADRYLRALDAPPVWRAVRPETLVSTPCDLAISNYAFTELERGVQDHYAEAVLARSLRGYITCNFIGEAFGIESWSRAELGELHEGSSWLPEEPLTREGNAILVWGTIGHESR